MTFIVAKLGRRFGLRFGFCLLVTGYILSAKAWNVWIYAVARFVVGLGDSTADLSFMVLINEITCNADHSSALMVLWTMYAIGGLVATWPLEVYWGYNWRAYQNAVLCLGVFGLVFVWFVPESFRWLLANGRVEEAKEALRKLTGSSDLDEDLDKLARQDEVRTGKNVAKQEEAAKTVTAVTL